MSKLNLIQKRTIVLSAIIMVVMLAFPPKHFNHHFTLNSATSGYGFIGAPLGGQIHWALLLVQWGAVIFLASAILFVSRDD